MRKVSLFMAIVLCLTMTSSAMAVACTASVSIPLDIPGLPGQVAIAPVEIDDASGLQAFDFTITYDSALLDLGNSDVHSGSLTTGWSITSNVDDSLGTAKINGYTTIPLGGGSGSLLKLDFHVTVSSGTSVLSPSGALNEGNIAACFYDGSIDIVPEPTTFTYLLCLSAAAVLTFRKRR